MSISCKRATPVFDTILLLADVVEQSVFPSVLLALNPALTILPVVTPDDLAAIEPDLLERSRLIAFTTPVIVPGGVLDRLGYGAYNFHPGPPRYPGWAPAHFALYDQATEFGSTVHLMVRQVDAGPIVEVATFAIPADITVSGLQGLAYANLAKLFWALAPRLATQGEPLPQQPISWGPAKTSRRSYAAICDIPLDISKDDFDRRIQIFGRNHFGVMPTLQLHGVTFRAVLPDYESAEMPAA